MWVLEIKNAPNKNETQKCNNLNKDDRNKTTAFFREFYSTEQETSHSNNAQVRADNGGDEYVEANIQLKFDSLRDQYDKNPYAVIAETGSR